MRNYKELFQTWYGHLLERLIRLHHYISERATEAPTSYSRPVRFPVELLRKVETLAAELRERSSYLQQDDCLAENKAVYYASARTIANAFRKLHRQVAFLPAPWPSPELEFFLFKVLEESGVASLREAAASAPWTILFSGEFNFSHILLPDLAAPSFEASILTIPAAERSNPLFWPNLVHEAAHGLAARSGLIEAAVHLPVALDRPPETQRVLREWAHEIVADLLAVEILGPAFFGAFVTFAAYWIPYPVRRGSERHPPPNLRVDYLQRRLTSNSPGFADILLAQLEAEFTGRLELDQADQEIRSALYDLASGTQHFPEPGLVYDFVAAILELAEFKRLQPNAFSQADVEVVTRLAKRLQRGELIASRRRRGVKESFDTEEEVEGRFSEALDQLEEAPNTVTEILNAAFARKLGYASRERERYAAACETPVGYHAGLLAMFCADLGEPVNKRLVEMRREVSTLDEVVAKSIEATSILSFYGRTESP